MNDPQLLTPIENHPPSVTHPIRLCAFADSQAEYSDAATQHQHSHLSISQSAFDQQLRALARLVPQQDQKEQFFGASRSVATTIDAVPTDGYRVRPRA
ncbi:hypothetical protein GWI33_014963 [Rhynchophorus ferrugineus]|uniref:Uncharacterized protein n=1 Tax=Rhynchophorus ferrugineus TaxID=354439 RepID=A0A834M8K9_RHYFE|nr:hypothetical protein GWI33_014963 [Rhynchophorus ferrugineus]